MAWQRHEAQGTESAREPLPGESTRFHQGRRIGKGTFGTVFTGAQFEKASSSPAG